MTNSFSNAENAEVIKDDGITSHQPFNNKWDLASTHAVQPTSSGVHASNNILAALRTRRGAETADWLNNLETQAALRRDISASQSNIPAIPPSLSLENGYSEANEQAMLSTAVKGLDIIFNEFEKYASQFNLTAEGTDFIVSCTHPIKRTHSSDHIYAEADETGLCYAGHLSTRFWALVVRGSASRVEVFIIPAELLLGFSVESTDESGYKPLLVIEAEWREGKLVWHMDQTIITLAVLPNLAKELFGDLIRVATGQMTESELFAHPLQDLTLGQNLAVGYSATTTARNNLPATAPTTDNQNKTVTQSALPPTIAGSPEAPLTLKTINIAQQLLTVINQDISQLMELGTQALRADDDANFQKIKALTEKMETFKTIISTGLTKIQ